MKKLLIMMLAAIALIAAANAQQREHNLVHFHMAIMKKGPKLETTAADRGRIFQQHIANVISMFEAGKLAIAGPFEDDSNLAGIFVVRTASPGEARSWVDADPAVKAGLMVPEMHPWW